MFKNYDYNFSKLYPKQAIKVTHVCEEHSATVIWGLGQKVINRDCQKDRDCKKEYMPNLKTTFRLFHK